MQARVRRTAVFMVCLLPCVLALLAPAPARALDKQGSAHGGQLSGADRGTAISGSVVLGAAVYNPTYAARPDNTGHALLRLAPHFDFDLIGSRLSIPLDLNVFTDRDLPGLDKLTPSELDVITGVTSTWPLGPTAIELGTRIEHDRPVDRGTYTQSYVDTRARLLFSLAHLDDAWRDRLGGGDLTGYLTLGLFIYNPSYAARPDNTGLALLRYAAHLGLSTLEQRLLFSVDTTFFTDRHSNPVAPSELDLTLGVGVAFAPFELHVDYERDMPVDHGDFVQQFVMVSMVYGFELLANTAAPPEQH